MKSGRIVSSPSSYVSSLYAINEDNSHRGSRYCESGHCSSVPAGPGTDFVAQDIYIRRKCPKNYEKKRHGDFAALSQLRAQTLCSECSGKAVRGCQSAMEVLSWGEQEIDEFLSSSDCESLLSQQSYQLSRSSSIVSRSSSCEQADLICNYLKSE
uniref:Uncharacterized protein n=1 Tax=Tetraselmis sp. GSL018 TaxID=582737 RepID=A0A061RCD1_9CHLO